LSNVFASFFSPSFIRVLHDLRPAGTTIRWSNSKLTDGARMAVGIPMVEGKRLMYRKPAN
jgi:hypothetical protein